MKKSIFKSILPIFVVSLGLILSSCGTTSGYKAKKFTTDWIKVTKDNANDCGRFFTTSELGKFSMITGEFKKEKGSEEGTYGFVFGYSGQNKGILSDYIRFEINPLGEYAVYSWVDGKYKDLINDDVENDAYMNQSSAIVKGLGSTNTLKVEKAKDGTYSCYVNNSCIASKIEPLANGTKGVMAFFSVAKSNQENLPEEAVELSYRITDSAFN